MVKELESLRVREAWRIMSIVVSVCGKWFHSNRTFTWYNSSIAIIWTNQPWIYSGSFGVGLCSTEHVTSMNWCRSSICVESIHYSANEQNSSGSLSTLSKHFESNRKWFMWNVVYEDISKRDKLIVAIKEGSRYCSVVPSRVSWPCQGNRPQEGSKLHSGRRGRPSPNPAVLEEDTSWTGWLHHWIEVVSDQRCFIVYCLTLCFLIGSHSRRVKPLVSFQFQAFLNESPCHINSAWWVSRNESECIRIHSPLDLSLIHIWRCRR